MSDDRFARAFAEALAEPPDDAKVAAQTGCLGAALEAGSRGWLVFPCGRDKRPLTAHGFKDASCAPNVVRQMWREHPGASVGIATGASGLVVIDLDCKNGAPGLDEWHKIKAKLGDSIEDTTLVETPSGGMHVYYRANGHKGGSTAGRLAEGIDTRADGGYVIGAGSPGYLYVDGHGPERLRKLPAILAERLAFARREPARGESAAPASNVIPEGTRDSVLASLAGTMRRRGMSHDEILGALKVTNEKRCRPPLSDAQVEKIARSVGRYEPGAAAREPASTAWPEPLAEAAYHGPIGELVRLWEPCNEADPAAMLVTMLVYVGCASGPWRHYPVGDDRHPPRLNAVIVGDSAAARKGMSVGPPNAAMGKVDTAWSMDCRAGGLSSGEGLIEHVRDRVEGYVGKGEDRHLAAIDPGVTDKRLLVSESEFGRTLTVMGRQDNTLSAVLRSFFDTGDARVMTRGQTKLRATDAHVCILGHITNEDLQTRLSDTDTVNGFANRFLWVCSRRQRLLPFGGRAADEDLAPAIARLKAAVRDASDPQFAGVVPFAAEARELWVDRYEALTVGEPGLVGVILARGAPLVVRLALIYALADRAQEIGLAHLQAALEVWRYCADSARYLFAGRMAVRDEDRLLDALDDAGTMDRTQIRVVFAGHRSRSALDAMLAKMADLGLIERVPSDSTGGRPRELWRRCVR